MEITILFSIMMLITLITFFVIWFQWTLLMIVIKKITRTFFHFFVLSCIVALFANTEQAPTIIKGLVQVALFFLQILITILEEII